MALYLSGGISGFFSHALRISPVNRTPHRSSSRLTLLVSDFAGIWRNTWPMRK